MTDENIPDTPQEAPADKPADESAPGAPKPEEHHGLRSEIAGVLGKVAGIAVETGSMLAGNAGAGVSAEGEIVEHDTEELVDGDEDEK